MADQHVASHKTVRPADRRYRAIDKLDRGLGVAVDAEPRQAHQIRGARWPILRDYDRRTRRCRRRAGLALSTEAHWNQNEADWRFFLSKGTVFGVRDGPTGRDRGVAALFVRQCLDQHGAGHCKLAPPRDRNQAGRCLSRRGRKRSLTAWLDATPAGANVYGPLGFTPTLQLRRLRLDTPTEPSITAPLSTCSLDSTDRPRQHRHGVRPQPAADRIQRRVPARISFPTATRWHSSATAARHGKSVRCSPTRRTGAGVGRCHRQSEAGPWLIDVVARRTNFWKVSPRGLEHRTAVPAHALRPGDHDFAELPFAVAGPEFG